MFVYFRSYFTGNIFVSLNAKKKKNLQMHELMKRKVFVRNTDQADVSFIKVTIEQAIYAH